MSATHPYLVQVVLERIAISQPLLHSQLSSDMIQVPQCTPMLFFAPRLSAMRTAPSGSVCWRCMCQRGSYDPIGIAARSTGPRTRPTASYSVGEYPVSPRWMNERGRSPSDLTWNADQSVAFVSEGERADQC